MNQLICPTCQFQNRPQNRFCTQCGQKFSTEESNGKCLVMLYGEGQELIFPIRKNSTTIGRDIDNDIVLRDEKISKKHATVLADENSLWIEDLTSKNGVYVNGERIAGRKQLNNGNLIKLGFTIFRFEQEKISDN